MKKYPMKLFQSLVTIITIIISSGQAFPQQLMPIYKPVPTICAQPIVYVGYLSSNKPTCLSFDVAGGNVFGIQALKQTLNTQGIWTELFVPVKTSGLLGLDVGAGYLFPSNSDSEERYNLASGSAGRNWRTSSQLWNAQVAITYDVYSSIIAVFGFRYQSFMINFMEYKDPFPNSLVFNELSLAGTNFSFGGYIPYLGARIERTLANAYTIRAGAIGFPALPGSFLYREVVTDSSHLQDGWRGNGVKSSNEFMSGYFLEALAEVAIPVSWWGQAGAFVKFSSVYGKTSMNLTNTVSRGVTSNPSTIYVHNDAGFTFDQSILVVGGSLSVSF